MDKTLSTVIAVNNPEQIIIPKPETSEYHLSARIIK